MRKLTMIDRYDDDDGYNDYEEDDAIQLRGEATKSYLCIVENSTVRFLGFKL